MDSAAGTPAGCNELHEGPQNRARVDSPSQVRTSVTWVPDEQTMVQESVSDASVQKVPDLQSAGVFM